MSAAKVRPYSGPKGYRCRCHGEPGRSWKRPRRSGACGQAWLSAGVQRVPSLLSLTRCPHCPRPSRSGVWVRYFYRLGKAGPSEPRRPGLGRCLGAAAPSQLSRSTVRASGREPGKAGSLLKPAPGATWLRRPGRRARLLTGPFQANICKGRQTRLGKGSGSFIFEVTRVC